MERTALRAFLMGLQEDIGRLLITKGPTDLNDAINILTNEYQFPTLRKKLFTPRSSQPSSSYQGAPQRQNFNKPNQQNFKTNQQFNRPSQQNHNKMQPNKTPQQQQPNQQFNRPYQQQRTEQPHIPYHMRTKDTMSYQTTLNHELTQEEPEENEEAIENFEEYEEDSFLEEPQEEGNST
ncbi:hypothetical protein GE061_001571 [Apolygus lucorum]|uniref:Uncharacterized protein n=1 Tax=Apolygus lucorum TaxID=248454 RepID=A0A6A4JM35_APOLU|nr:hypothetical protein GE061_003506 [Apolygus lucorum]KAF6203379.1 hypothetical protein GE061_003798 [Apolygus lucorum]KAF6217217.1 hypothetical protein GE061_001571 [Apolygus lucorum]